MNTDTRTCSLYRFWVLDPATGYTTRVLGYVGETARIPFERLMEHVYAQPWADTIVGWEVDPTVYTGKAAVLAAEKAAVRRERPLYNVEWNMGNPDRIPPWKAERQARARGRTLPTGKPQARRSPPRGRSGPTHPKPTRPRRTSTRAQHRVRVAPRLFGHVAVWLLLAGALWWVRAADWPGWEGPRNGGLGSAGVIGAVWVASLLRRRR